MWCGPRPCRSARQTYLSSGGTERCLNILDTQRLSSQRDKHVVVEWRIRASVFQITFESCSGSVMQGNEAPLAELGTSDHQPIWRNVLIVQLDGFRYPKSGASQKRE